MITYALPDGTTVDYVPREEWMTAEQLATLVPGRRWDGSPSTYGVVHHTAGAYPAGGTIAEQREMRNAETWARNSGYWTSGYSWKVGPSGTLYQCRGWEYEPAATGAGDYELDPMSHAVCAQGNHSTYHADGRPGHTPDPFTDAAARAVGRILAAGVALGFLRVDAKVIGHRDNPNGPGRTDCPGDAVMDKLGAIVAVMFAALTPPGPGPVPPPAPGAGGCTYVVQAGDHAARIGGAVYGPDLGYVERRARGLAILEHNATTEAALRPGQGLHVPGLHR